MGIFYGLTTGFHNPLSSVALDHEQRWLDVVDHFEMAGDSRGKPVFL